MFNIIKFLEDVLKFIRIKIKVCYWKIKYGKRLKIGKKFRFRKRFSINISKDGYVEIGNNVFFNDDCSINCHEKIIIGNNCIFGQQVLMFDHDHDQKKEKIKNKPCYITKPIIIENNCWIGALNIILRGTKIYNNSIIGAGCLLKEEIPANYICIQKRNTELKKI